MNLSLITHPVRAIARLALGGLFVMSLASCGGGGGSPGKIPGAPTTVAAGSVTLIFSSSELQSSGTAGTEVTVTALVKTPDNNVLAGVPVTVTADANGAITLIDAVSDKNGQAKATLGTSGDHTLRTITVTAKAGGKTASGTVNVVGTSVAVAGPAAITAGNKGDFVVSVKDSVGVGIANVPVSFTSGIGNTVVVKKSGGGTATAPTTDSQGQVTLTVTAAQSDTLTVTAQGFTAVASITVNSITLAAATYEVTGVTLVTQADTSTSCSRIKVRYENNGTPQDGTVNITTSRGSIYTDSACTIQQVASSVAVVGGDSAAAYVKSNTIGVATITASVAGGPVAQTNLEFVAKLTAAATISVQADPAVIGTSNGANTTKTSTLKVVVRDGTQFNNLVKGAIVEFSIIQDRSGGSLSNPSVQTTGSNGAAEVTYFAGPSDTPTDGVEIQARIQSPITAATATAKLTVSRQSLFISTGTGNAVATPSSTQYQKDYAVFVTDASGNPVSGVTITATAVPTKYFKGFYRYDAAATLWVYASPGYPDPAYSCDNEDVNNNGILDPGEDFNNNGRLDPGIPLNVSSTGKTDATGSATVSILYPRDRGQWTQIKLTINGSVTGTEATATTTFILPVLASDFTTQTVNPPGNPSPYGVNVCTIKD